MARQLPIPEAARILGVSQDTVRRKIRRGDLAAIQQPTPQGHVWLVEVPEVHREPATSTDVELLRDELMHWREMVDILREELAARRREVQELIVLLERVHLQPAPAQDPRDPPAGPAPWPRDGAALAARKSVTSP